MTLEALADTRQPPARHSRGDSQTPQGESKSQADLLPQLHVQLPDEGDRHEHQQEIRDDVGDRNAQKVLAVADARSFLWVP